MPKQAGLMFIIAILIVFTILHLGFSPSEIEMRVIITTALGGLAFLLMTLAIFLSTKATFLEDIFGGLDRIYQVHKICGVLSGLLVLAHFFGVPKELPIGVSEIEMPLFPSALLGILALIFLVISLAITLNRKIPYHRWRLPHKAMGLVYFMIIGHFMTAPTIFFYQYSASGIMLMAAAAIGVSSYLYNIFGMNRKTAHRYIIEKVNPLARATELILEPIDRNITFKPGQFAFLEIQGQGWSEPHPFTISSAPSEDGLRFTLKVLGDWTRKVREELDAGREIIVRGPYGKFDMQLAGNKQVWFAGGIGITPFLSTIRDMQANDPREIILIYAVRDQAEALFLEELKQKASDLGNVNIVLLQSNEGEFACVDIMKTKLAEPITSYDYFLCGPKPMLDALKKALKADGVAPENVHFEAFEFR